MKTTSSEVSSVKICVIIVAYNNAECLKLCLASIHAGDSQPFSVIIIDNSTSFEVERAFAGNPSVVYYRSGENLGFCSANNVGISKALDLGATHVLLLNHDTEISRTCLSALRETAITRNAPALVTGKIFLLENRKMLWYAGGYFSPWIGAGKNRGFGEIDAGKYDHIREIDYSTGCLMLIPAEIIRKIGMLNEELFMYLDDIEYCLRAKAAGFSIVYEPKAHIWHELGSGAGLRQRPDYYLYFSLRNKPRVVSSGWYRCYLTAAMMLFGAVKFLQFALTPGIPRRSVKLRAILLGVWDGFHSGARYKERFPQLFSREKPKVLET